MIYKLLLKSTFNQFVGFGTRERYTGVRAHHKLTTKYLLFINSFCIVLLSENHLSVNSDTNWFGLAELMLNAFCLRQWVRSLVQKKKVSSKFLWFVTHILCISVPKISCGNALTGMSAYRHIWFFKGHATQRT